jgi:hypothetical protein
MRFLRGGGTAVDAVEAAIKVLEDKEITNAGYGSNLTIEGIVECDATVVDHLGRSGACGAVASMFKAQVNLMAMLTICTRNQKSDPPGPDRSRRVQPPIVAQTRTTEPVDSRRCSRVWV